MGKMVLTSSGFGSSVASSSRGVGSVSVAGPSSYHERRDRLARTCGYLAYLPLDGIASKPRPHVLRVSGGQVTSVHESRFPHLLRPSGRWHYVVPRPQGPALGISDILPPWLHARRTRGAVWATGAVVKIRPPITTNCCTHFKECFS